MKKNDAEKLVNETFTGKYDENQFRGLVQHLFLNYEPLDENASSGKYIPESFQAHILSFKRIAKFQDPETREIDVLAVKLKNRRVLENARTMQRNFIARYLNGSRGGQLKDAALVAFYSDDSEDWRFSLIKMDYVLDEAQQKIKKELTPARRYSFLVGKNEKTHTVRKQLLPVFTSETETTLNELEHAFNIETVTKEFFEKYKTLYLSLKKALDAHLKKDSIVKNEFESKDVKTSDFSKRLLGQIVFLYFLQKKGWLGVEKRQLWGTGPKDFLQRLYRQERNATQNFFNDVLEPLFYEALATERADNFYQQFNCKIPFLNGGLFEPIRGYDWVNTDIMLDNAIFEEIFDVFDLYNFTVREDEPLDKEVAVDPEMLGKVFENLIPENERKGSGTYYTPREIVHYMCQESLINFIESKVDQNLVPRKDIEALVHHGDIAIENELTAQEKHKNENYGGDYQHKIPESIRSHSKQIDDALADIKICDPAIGSGAFPVGMMNEIVRTRYSLTPFIDDLNRTLYDFKRHAIQESIYGVDIESSAVDIAKLRLWLSLVVDEDDFETIKPLPNLEYKICVGNSLMSFPFISEGQKEKLNKLTPLKNQYFNETSPSKKLHLKKQINLILQSEYDNPNQEKAWGYKVTFDYQWSFHEVFEKNDGFDVVIGNPPYGILNKKQNKAESIIVSPEEAHFYKNSTYYEPATGGMLNIFRLFILRSIKLLNKSGVFSEIFPLAFLCDLSISKLRKHILENNQIICIEAFPERDNPNKRVFEAVKMSVCILNLKKKNSNAPFFIRINTDRYIDLDAEKNYLSRNDIDLLDEQGCTFPLISSSELNLLLRIFSNSVRFRAIGVCKTGEVDMTFCKECFTKNSNDINLLKGAIIDRYQLRVKMSQGEIVYINEEKLFSLKQNLQRDFKTNERIVLQGITGVNEASRLKMMIVRDVYCANSLNYLALKQEISLNYLLGLFNSKLLNFIFSKFSTNSNVNGYEVDNLPIAINKTFIQPISAIVDKILKITNAADYLKDLQKQANVKEYENQIDQLIYQLYSLTNREIAIVEATRQ